MRKFLIIVGLFFIYEATTAQSAYKRQPGTLVNLIPYQIEVSDQATTIILFPFEVKDADMGVGELLATKIPDMKNIIKLKAQGPALGTTSLYVVTSDGKLHAFEVTYTNRPHPIAYELDLTGAMSTSSTTSVLFEQQPYSQADLNQWVACIRQDVGSMAIRRRVDQLALTLEEVYSVKNFVFLKFNIKNHSTLPYMPGWIQLYMKDRRKAKRSAVQEMQLVPVYLDTLVELSGHSSRELIIGIPRQTIPRSRKLIFELHEDNGGRNMRFGIKNRFLLTAKRIS